jgi:hypothetical protein
MNEPLVRQNPVAAQAKVVLDEIFALCQDACDARKAASQGSAEWHKRTGEVLGICAGDLIVMQARIAPSLRCAA